MIALLTGKFAVLTPTLLVMDVQGVGYELNISLNTFAALQGKESGRLHTYLKVSEDSLTLWGFAEAEEKEMFLKLIGISGVGASTARIMLSSLKPAEIVHAIQSGDTRSLERVKGIGKKTAERLVLELKDKLKRTTTFNLSTTSTIDNTAWNDALDALVALGIQRAQADAAIKKLQDTLPQTANAEEIIKQVLKTL